MTKKIISYEEFSNKTALIPAMQLDIVRAALDPEYKISEADMKWFENHIEVRFCYYYSTDKKWKHWLDNKAARIDPRAQMRVWIEHWFGAFLKLGPAIYKKRHATELLLGKEVDGPDWVQDFIRQLKMFPGVYDVDFNVVDHELLSPQDSQFEAYCGFECQNVKTLWLLSKTLGEPSCDPVTSAPKYSSLRIEVVPTEASDHLNIAFSIQLPGTQEACETEIPALAKELKEVWDRWKNLID